MSGVSRCGEPRRDTLDALMRETVLDRKWDELMSLCRKEAEFKRDCRHPKLVRFLGD